MNKTGVKVFLGCVLVFVLILVFLSQYLWLPLTEEIIVDDARLEYSTTFLTDVKVNNIYKVYDKDNREIGIYVIEGKKLNEEALNKHYSFMMRRVKNSNKVVLNNIEDFSNKTHEEYINERINNIIFNFSTSKDAVMIWINLNIK